jgi:hypothetical protein
MPTPINITHIAKAYTHPNQCCCCPDCCAHHYTAAGLAEAGFEKGEISARRASVNRILSKLCALGYQDLGSVYVAIDHSVRPSRRYVAHKLDHPDKSA